MTPLLAVLAFATTPLPSAATETWELYSESRAFIYSEPVSVNALLNDWNDTLESGDIAFTHNHFEAGARYKGFRIAKILRYDYVLRFNGQTANAFHQEQNDIEINPDENFDLLLAPQHARSNGLLVGYRWKIAPNLLADFAITRLEGIQLLDGEVSISVSGADFDDENLDRANAQVNYHYSEPKLSEEDDRTYYDAASQSFGRWNPDEPNGEGWSADIHLNWQIDSHFNLDLRIEDLYHSIKWDQAPFTRDQYLYDPDVHILPTFEGHLGTESFKQRFKARQQLRLKYDYSNRWAADISLYRANGVSFPRISVQCHWLWTQWKISYDTKAKATGVSLHNKYLSFDVLSDNLKDHKEAHTIGLRVGLHLPFL